MPEKKNRRSSFKKEFLLKIMYGKENAKTREQLAEITGWGDATIRHNLSLFAQYELPICSSSHRAGYFIPRPDRMDEIDMLIHDREEQKKKRLVEARKEKVANRFLLELNQKDLPVEFADEKPVKKTEEAKKFEAPWHSKKEEAKKVEEAKPKAVKNPEPKKATKTTAKKKAEPTKGFSVSTTIRSKNLYKSK